jgi:hypothetical protein
VSLALGRTAAALTCTWALAAASLAIAITLDVDPTGGPLVLEDRVDAAVAAWRDAGLDVDAVDRRVRIRFGDPALLGPDVPVLIATTEDPDVDLDLLVHPDLLDTYPGALIHALGIAFGGEAGDGALDARQREGVAPAPTEQNVAAIAAARAADPADLNRDGVVDFEDLLILAERFGGRGVNLPGDLDGDGVIDERDLAILRESYTFTPLRTTPPTAPAGEAPGALPPVPSAVPGPAPTPAPSPVPGAPPVDDPVDEDDIEEEDFEWDDFDDDDGD